jgi:hypothetical protein
MNTKRWVKLFEEFERELHGEDDKELLLDILSDDALFENYDEEFNDEESEEDEPSYSRGERAALTRGDQLLTIEQMAALYLVAKNRFARREDKSDTYAGRMAQRMNKETDESDFREANYNTLADWLAVNPLTVSRTVNKFIHLLSGMESHSEVIYDKIRKAFNEFENMQEAEVLALAESALDIEADDTISSQYLDKTRQYQERSRENQKRLEKEVGDKVYSLFKGFRSAFKDKEPTDLAMKAINKIASEMSLEPNKVKDLTRKFLMQSPDIRSFR